MLILEGLSWEPLAVGVGVGMRSLSCFPLFKWFGLVISFCVQQRRKPGDGKLSGVDHISSLAGSCPKWPSGHPYSANYREEKAKAFAAIKKLFCSGLCPVSVGLQSYQPGLPTPAPSPAGPSLGGGEDPGQCLRKKPREQGLRPREAEPRGLGPQWFCLQVPPEPLDPCLRQGGCCPARSDLGSCTPASETLFFRVLVHGFNLTDMYGKHGKGQVLVLGAGETTVKTKALALLVP